MTKIKSDLYGYDAAIASVHGIIAGTDEAGRGPLAGPVVAAAVILDPHDIIDGINDSKKLSAVKRERLYDEIVSRAKAWAVAEASPQEIDKVNILNASLGAMKTSLDKMGVNWDLVLVDGNRNIKGIPDNRQVAVVKGDATSACIAAASILAKVHRDRIMMKLHEQYPLYGFDSHMGYPTEQHRRMLVMHGMSPVHRHSFCEGILSRAGMDLFDQQRLQ